MRVISCALLASAVAFVSIACQSIAGIEERVFDEERAACESYCDDMEANCQERLAEQGYSDRETCIDVCLLFDHETSEIGGNTLACRRYFVERVEQPDDAHEYCQAAGPAGGYGECGSLCENYCALFEAAGCTPVVEDCVAKCEGLPRAGTFNPQANYDGDTVECRIVHASAAAGGDTIHCDHAKFVSTLHCLHPANEDASGACSDLCTALEVGCTGAHEVYEDRAQCMAVCEAFPDPGVYGDHDGNTVGCRYYHAQNALTDAKTHCGHAGPGGGGRCGGSASNCDSYCALVQAACPDEYDEVFDSAGGCESECSELDGSEAESKYSVATAETESAFSCRLLYTARALTDASACGAALGLEAPCE